MKAATDALPVGLRAELKARDQFLAKAVSTLATSALALDRALRAEPAPACVRTANAELQALLSELRVIAEPDLPVRLRCRKLELCAWLERFLAEREATFARSGLALSLHRKGSILCHLDRGYLATMLDELLSNALKYRRGQAVSVQIAHAGKLVAIRVINHVRWIGPKPAFRRFQRGASQPSVPGFGIGLWLTRRLAEAHGGRFSIRAATAQTQAIIWLPHAARSDAHAELHATLVAHGR